MPAATKKPVSALTVPPGEPSRRATPRAPSQESATAPTTPASRTTLALGESGRFSSSLMAGLAILDRFSAEQPQLGIAALADQLSMTRSTTHRYASTLVALGYLEQDRARQYRLAPRVADLGLALLDSMTLRRHAHEPLRQLRSQTGRTVSMAILDDSHIRYVERLRGWRQGQHAIDLGLGVAVRLPLHCTAMGKVLLAYLPEPQRERLIDELRLSRQGPHSITSKRELRAELERVRRAGLAVSDEELAQGLRAAAAPVLDEQGVVLAAVAVSVPCDAFSRKELVARLGPAVKATAERISSIAQAQA